MGVSYMTLTISKSDSSDFSFPVGVKKITAFAGGTLTLFYNDTAVNFFVQAGENTFPYISGYPTKIRIDKQNVYRITVLETGTPCTKMTIPVNWITETVLSSSDEESDDSDIHEASE